MQIEVWVCPSGHYFAGSSVHGADISKQENHAPVDLHTKERYGRVVTGNRAICQNCKQVGVDAERKLIAIEVDLADVFPETAVVA